MDYKITPCTEEEADYIDSRLIKFNLSQVPAESAGRTFISWMPRKVTDDNGNIIAGCNAAVTIWNTAMIEILWVAEPYRRQGIGTELLGSVEQEMKGLGCNVIQLDTFDFQAKDFYLKNGYTVFGTLENCPKGHCRYYMKKDL